MKNQKNQDRAGPFFYGEEFLTPGLAIRLASGDMQGVISENAKLKIVKSQTTVHAIVQKGEPVYGINTGFGPLCTTSITSEETRILQSNLLKSHSVGVGPPVPREISKLMLILKVHSLALGYSGISPETLDRILWHIDKDLVPVVPSQGSVGASGDLAPLAHLFLPLIGFGLLDVNGQALPADQVLESNHKKALELGPKEGLALINGTQLISAYAIWILKQFHSLLSQADIIGAMMIEGLQGSMKPFHPKLHNLRAFKGNIHVAGRIHALLENSEIMQDHALCERVQDPYSLRCIPQVHGASRNTWLHLKELLEIELNSVTDNPVIIDEDLSISGGNFHGQPLALALDYACVAAAEIGNISDRRVYLALKGNSPGVPKLLMHNTGINSGYMILQYTTAALVSENKTMCFPASADSIPTSLGQEDHVSMGSIGARKTLNVLNNLEKILAIELLTAAQAFEFRQPLKSGPVLNEIHGALRSEVPFAQTDRIFSDDIGKAVQMIRAGTILQIARRVSLKKNISLETLYETEFETY